MIPPILCEQPDDVAAVEALPGYRLRVSFHDGVSGTVDMSRRVHSPDAGVFAGLADASRFAEVAIRFGAVWWPGEVELDLAPDVMYEALRESGEWVLD